MFRTRLKTSFRMGKQQRCVNIPRILLVAMYNKISLSNLMSNAVTKKGKTKERKKEMRKSSYRQKKKDVPTQDIHKIRCGNAEIFQHIRTILNAG